jgi:hypothetical protein
MYSTDETVIFKIINRFENKLHLLSYDKNGEVKISTKSYGNTSTLKKHLIVELKTLCINDNWLTESQFSSLGKLLFSNGYYDMHTGEFNDKFDPVIIEINKGPDMDAKDKRDSELKHKVAEDLLITVGIIDQMNVKRKNGFLPALIQQGCSQYELRSYFNVVGYRVGRFCKETKNPGLRQCRFTTHVPKHAFTEEDKQRVKDHVKTRDPELEEGFPRQHKRQQRFFRTKDQTWGKLWQEYKQFVNSLNLNVWVMSKKRWRQYVAIISLKFVNLSGASHFP